MPVALQVLQPEQIEQVLEAAFTILERTGTIIEHHETLHALRDRGAEVGKEAHVRIPRQIVRDALSTAPSVVDIYNRCGEKAMSLGDGTSHYEAKMCAVNTMDFDTSSSHPTSWEDIMKAARVADALPNISYVAVNTALSGVNPDYADVAGFAVTVRNTTKPIVHGVVSQKSAAMILELAAASVGGMSTLRKRPFTILGDSPVAPLYHPAEPIENILLVAYQGLPCVYNPMPIGGITAPATAASVLALTLAEALTGLVITQVARPGAPYICGGTPSIFDMRSFSFVYGSPELLLMCAALSDVAQHCGLPVIGTAGMSDSKAFDAQAACDAALSTLLAALSGANLVHNNGLIGSKSACLPLVVLGNEIIGITKRIREGLEISPETLALNVIDEVGPRGAYLAHKHTVAHFRESWMPTLFDHSTNAEQSRTMEERITDVIERILETHFPEALSDDAEALIRKYSSHWELAPGKGDASLLRASG